MIPRKLLQRQGFFADAEATSAHDVLMEDVFDFTPLRSARGAPRWMPFAYFEGDGRCVASVEAARLELLLDGQATCVTAIRLAAVAESHRGEGLFKALMTHALAWCEAECPGPTLLYTEDHALYARFGFAPLAQHAFAGVAPPPSAMAVAAPLDRAAAWRHFDRLAPHRVPVSEACAIVGADDLFREILRGDEPYTFTYAAEIDALLAHEAGDEDTLVLVDIVAAAMPTMAQIVGALGGRRERVRTLFPPDRLGWDARAEGEETGLMIRGMVPDALRRPFMLPPTTAF